MASKVKSAKSKISNKDGLKNETEEKVEVKQLLTDERTHKIIGTLFLLMSFLFFVAFTSYLFTWEEDQDKVFLHGSKLLMGTDDKVSNLLGTFGAYISHFFIYKGFGIAAYFICSFFFVAGVNLFFGQKIFSVRRNLKYVIVGLIIISLSAAVVMNGKTFSWGGAVGNMLKDYLYQTIGKTGTVAVIIVALLSYIIWRFNPTFTLPSKKIKTFINEDLLQTESENTYTENAADVLAAKEIINEDKKTNAIKGDGGMMNIPLHVNPFFSHDLQMVEKEQPVNEIEKVIVPGSRREYDINKSLIIDNPLNEQEDATSNTFKNSDTSELELEIKTESDLQVEKDVTSTSSKRVSNVDTPYDPILDLRDYKYPQLDLLEAHGSEKIIQDPAELETNKNQIIDTLKNYDINIQKIYATVGPTVTLYEIIPAPGVRISRIKNLEDDIALSLAALGIRIIAPIPGKGTIGIEVPNAKKTIVSMRTLLDTDKFRQNNFSLPIAIGKKINNENFIVDLASMPHLLMAGATGQGKSVGLNAILVSLLYSKHPSQLKFVLVDPKKVELSIYKTIEKHFLAKLPGEEDAIITDTKKVVHTLNALCIEMDNRYDLLKEAGCRNIREYNEKFIARKLNPENGHQFLPFIVLVVDEFADLIMTAGKEVEVPIARLAQLARAVGVHLIIATQRPSVNIITGTIKANFPARIAFKVSSKIDSRTILDAGGAEQLIGKGDMLISYNGELVRLQCAFVDTPEVDKIVDFIGSQRGYSQAFLLPEYVDEKALEGKDFDLNDKDALFGDAARLIVTSQSGSTSLLQRRMKLGYNRAGRLMDQLEAAGIVGPNQGSKVRDVLIKTEAELQMYLDN